MTLDTCQSPDTISPKQGTDRDETANVALLPCPFCSSTNVQLRHAAQHEMSWVSCTGCGLEAPSETGTSEGDAVSYWNRRAAPTLPADVKSAEPWNEPPLTCPHIDAAIASGELSDVVKAELATIRDINSQLRYGTWALRAEITSQSAMLDRAREVIKPFAAIAAEYADQEDDEFQVWKDFDVLGATLPLKIFRAASRLIADMGGSDA